MTKKVKTVLFAAGFLLIGILLGGYLFSKTQSRSILALHKCEQSCLRPNELAGLVASVGIQRFSSFIPSVVMETDKTIVIEHPAPQARIHYLIIPKKDIKNIAEASEDDKEYLVDVFRVVSYIVKEQHLEQYRVVTNGSSYQTATYLHFHLTAQ
jgi:histidine triad (HIT) family protein